MEATTSRPHFVWKRSFCIGSREKYVSWFTAHTISRPSPVHFFLQRRRQRVGVWLWNNLWITIKIHMQIFRIWSVLNLVARSLNYSASSREKAWKSKQNSTNFRLFVLLYELPVKSWPKVLNILHEGAPTLDLRLKKTIRFSLHHWHCTLVIREL